MNLFVEAGRLYVPHFIKKRKLHELFRATAEAFMSETPALNNLSTDDCLEKYAVFTRDSALKYIGQEKEQEIKSRLYHNAFELASNLKKGFHISTSEEAMKMACIVYKIIKIDLEVSSNKELVFRQCYFSNYYSSRVCSIISSLDEGLMAGLSGGKLKFSQRITEGAECCLARLSSERSPE